MESDWEVEVIKTHACVRLSVKKTLVLFSPTTIMLPQLGNPLTIPNIKGADVRPTCILKLTRKGHSIITHELGFSYKRHGEVLKE